MGIPKTQVACIQRSRTGQVNITFTKAELRDLFLSKVATTFEQRRPFLDWPGSQELLWLSEMLPGSSRTNSINID